MQGPFHPPVDGTFNITGHQLILSSRKEGAEELWVRMSSPIICLMYTCLASFNTMYPPLQLLIHNVDAVERKINVQSGGGSIILKCKDFRIIQLDISTAEDVNKVALTLEQLSSISKNFYFIV